MNPHRQALASALVLALALASSACLFPTGSGVVTTTTREVPPFRKVSVASGITVKASPGAREVRVRADDNLQELVLTVVELDTLAIRLPPSTVVGAHAALEVTVANDALEGIEASGGSRAFFTATPVPHFRAAASGASRVEVAELSSTDFTADASGGSTIELSGAVSRGLAGASGASALSLEGVPLETLHVDLSGASTARARVSSTVTGGASGASTLTITGSPQVHVDTSGGSQVRAGATP